jgi:hypothetical protein
MRVKHQPTEEMWADILTKPLQGTAFRQMHAKLMNCKENYEEDKVAFEHSMAKAAHARKTFQQLGEWLREAPPRCCRSVLGDLNTAGGNKQRTDNLLVCVGF